ncbi:MAG TPA: response regulator transcription factor, partial [Caldithrix abyssi]|nr:response regulator transcription factor [Caldithrix abyssi]
MEEKNKKNIRILIADDHAIVREGLKQIVARSEGLHVAGEADSAASLFHLLEQDDWDIVVLDINMPDRSGLDALKQIKVQYPEVPVLILSMYSEAQYGVRAIKAGAAGYLKKVSAPEELVTA